MAGARVAAPGTVIVTRTSGRWCTRCVHQAENLGAGGRLIEKPSPQTIKGQGSWVAPRSTVVAPPPAEPLRKHGQEVEPDVEVARVPAKGAWLS